MCRMSSNFETITGKDKLGIEPVNDPESPMYGTVPTTGVMGAQFECIYFARFLRPFGKRVLKGLTSLFEARTTRHWYTIYLALFILLHSSSMTARRDMEYAATLGLPVSIRPSHKVEM